jgi:hypothetical protein
VDHARRLFVVEDFSSSARPSVASACRVSPGRARGSLDQAARR